MLPFLMRFSSRIFIDIFVGISISLMKDLQQGLNSNFAQKLHTSYSNFQKQQIYRRMIVEFFPSNVQSIG
jgi:hypothetical protein